MRGAPQERDHPYNLYDKFPSAATAVSEAVAAAHGGRVFVVSYTPLPGVKPPVFPFPARYRLVQTRKYPEFVGVTLDVYAPTAATGK